MSNRDQIEHLIKTALDESVKFSPSKENENLKIATNYLFMMYQQFQYSGFSEEEAFALTLTVLTEALKD